MAQQLQWHLATKLLSLTQWNTSDRDYTFLGPTLSLQSLWPMCDVIYLRFGSAFTCSCSPVGSVSYARLAQVEVSYLQKLFYLSLESSMLWYEARDRYLGWQISLYIGSLFVHRQCFGIRCLDTVYSRYRVDQILMIGFQTEHRKSVCP